MLNENLPQGLNVLEQVELNSDTLRVAVDVFMKEQTSDTAYLLYDAVSELADSIDEYLYSHPQSMNYEELSKFERQFYDATLRWEKAEEQGELLQVMKADFNIDKAS